MTYQPTAEQIEALANDYAAVLGLRDDRNEGDPSDAYLIVVDGLAASSAFQAIIRAAQEQAWREGWIDRASRGFPQHKSVPDPAPGINPYRTDPTA